MINKQELYIHILCLIHVILWLIVLFGGFVSCELAILNLYIFLPLFYIAQSMPFHFIMKEKIKYIKDNKQYLHKKKLNLPEKEVIELSIEAKKLNMTPKELIDILGYIENYADKYVIPYYFEKLKRNLSNSWRNPLSPQGVIILGFILNLLSLKFRYNINL